MPAIVPSSLKTEAGVQKLDEHLADNSYVASETGPKAEDMACFAALASIPDKAKFPNAARWFRHIHSVRGRSAPFREWPKASGIPDSKEARVAMYAAMAANGKKTDGLKSKKAPMEVDVKVTPWVGDVHKPSKTPPTTGLGGTPVKRKTGDFKGKYYVTTAINYANGWPHMGHAYEAIVSDVFSRHHRLMGEDTFYMTGSDEHGQKIAAKAEEEGMTPQASVDKFVDGFKALNQRLLIANNYYVRTTDDVHKAYAQKMWKLVKDKGDIYFGNYEGWYCVREEKYFTDTEATESDFKDPVSGVPLERRAEASFFFKMSKYAERLVKHFEDNPSFVQPAQYHNEILTRLKSIDLRDLSISRGTFAWGVPCPEDKVKGAQHVMYVWFDALINYASGIDAGNKANPLSRFWPADMHVVGKDISWFHSVIWPTMLMSAGMELPKSIVVHGFIAGPDGRKMSKSLGNVIDAHDELDTVSPDTFRWYICRESAYGDDLKFSVEAMKLMHNADLCGNLGNLVNRAVTLCGGAVPELGKEKVALPFDLAEAIADTSKAHNEFRLSEAADVAVRACTATNKWITDLAPWNMKEESQKGLRATLVRLMCEAVFVLAHLFGPFTPAAGEAILKKLGAAPIALPDLSAKFNNLKTGTQVTTGTVLFQVFDMSGAALAAAPVAAPAAAPAAAPKAAPAAAKTEKPPAKEKAAAKAAPAADDDSQPLFSKLDVRVGKVVDAWFHPEADRLFVEMIDVGDPEGPRQIVSGLREHYKLEEFKGRKLLAVCNMKPSKLVKVDSYGMVLCAKEGDKVELLSVPDNLEVGTRVLPEGVPATFAPIEPSQVKKKKVWEGVAEKLQTDKSKNASFDGKALVGPGGEKFTASFANAHIS